jgi:hypothetical protein
LDASVTPEVWGIKIADNGDVWVVGDIQTAGGHDVQNIAVWNGSSWSAPGHLFDSANQGNGIDIGFYDPVIPSGYDIYMVNAGATAATAAGSNTVTNDGTAAAFPRITIERSGGTNATVSKIRNETTGLELLFDFDLLDGEKITIDLTPGNKTIQSDWRGNIIGALLPNSDFGTFALQPGDNEIFAFVSIAGAPTITTQIIWKEQYWSVSGAE